MAVDITITLNLVGQSQGPLFNLYSDTDNFSSPYETNISQALLQQGYLTSAPNGTNVVRVCSVGNLCTNCVNITPVYTTTTEAGVQCGEITESGGAGISEYSVTLEQTGGVIVIDFQAAGVPDKLEILHNGVKVATSGMTTPNSGPFDNIWGDPNIPTAVETLTVDQFIGSQKGIPPKREAELLSETGKTFISQKQQLIWWSYDASDVVTNESVVIRITGPNGTQWNLIRRCDEDLLLEPGFISDPSADGSLACAILDSAVNKNVYVETASGGPTISVGDTLFQNPSGSSLFPGTGEFYKMNFISNPGTYYSFKVNQFGVVEAPLSICPS
jgi:hypothetical protein